MGRHIAVPIAFSEVKMPELRAHHTLCSQFFRGRGYSGEFTRHMGETISGLLPETMVSIACGTDELCKKCPHNAGGVCDAEEKAAGYDAAVAELCGFSPGEALPYSAIKRAVYENIILPGRRESVCGDCEWSGFCKDNSKEDPRG